MRKYLPLLPVIALLTACATTDESTAYPGKTAKQIYEAGHQSLQEKSYTEAIKHFEALDTQYPDVSYTATALLELAEAYYKKEEYALAIATARRFIALYPADPRVDYAYYLCGFSEYDQNIGFFEKAFSLDLAKRDLTPFHQAYQDFKTIVERFPKSQYTKTAQMYVTRLNNMFARHELEVAEYYFSREAYVASAERASRVITRFKGTEAYPKAQALLIKSYHALGETVLEQAAIKATQTP